MATELLKAEGQKSQLTDIRRATASIEGKLSEVLGRLSDVEGRLGFLEDAAAEAKANPAATEVESFCRRLDEITITHWLNEDTIDHNKQAAAPPTKSGPKSGKHAKLETDVTDFLKDWLKDLPTIAEAQRPTKTRSSITQAQPSPNYIGNINRQLQLLE
ncbi:hypothetical protein AAFF_G00168680 [Aldrovandia affinis]|uniref:Uncharacterized protein n=1 Tax=Aldrovandia affinis TaxID=143900 RepID=A0AAD7W721_9TELE|nr:hypothetical protein AAFF_G00168680 [Aldrovandia affinis]